MLIFACHASTHMVGAGDTWVALACGRHFYNHGVDTIEPFSANSHQAGPTEEDVKTWPKPARWIAERVGLQATRYWHPTGWINQNWLTHVIFYWLTHESPFADAQSRSFNTLVYWKFAVYIIVVVCVYYSGRILGANAALSAVFACFAMFVGRSFLDIRPAGFSNLLVAVFLLVLALATHRNILYIWLIAPIMVFWCNVHGGYIYVFIMLVPFVVLNFLTSFSKQRFVNTGLKGLCHTMGAGLITLIAVIVFNPFHLTNLTHTFVISVSRDAEMWRSVNEWHRAFEWNNPVGDEIPFLIMYVLAWVVVSVWVVTLVYVVRVAKRRRRRRARNCKNYQSPRIDLAMMVISGFTIYMAIRSRRFIPIAAISACPILAAMVDQVICGISAIRNFRKHNALTVSPAPRKMQWIFVLVGAPTVLFFGTWWGLKFKRVYLDPWPMDSKLNSVFMRMTASDAKPFYACEFMKINKLNGKMFNYWTEGGFISWGQEPQPKTGKAPLQLFMDGRAQAAYEPKVYKVWSNIMSGGRIVRDARTRKRELTSSDYTEIGRWIDERLKKHDVWVVLMPAGQFAKPFVKGLEHDPDWRIIFLNDKQKLFVDTTRPEGRKLFEGIFNNTTVYPDDISKNLVLAHNTFVFGKGHEAKKWALAHAAKAFNLSPSYTSMREIATAARFAELTPQINGFCKHYFELFVKYKDTWAKQDGYYPRVMSALIAGGHLQRIAAKENNHELARFYSAKQREYENERRQLVKRRRW